MRQATIVGLSIGAFAAISVAVSLLLGVGARQPSTPAGDAQGLRAQVASLTNARNAANQRTLAAVAVAIAGVAIAAYTVLARSLKFPASVLSLDRLTIAVALVVLGVVTIVFSRSGERGAWTDARPIPLQYVFIGGAASLVGGTALVARPLSTMLGARSSIRERRDRILSAEYRSRLREEYDEELAGLIIAICDRLDGPNEESQS